MIRATERGEVLDAPVGVRLHDELVLEPDIVVVLQAHSDRIHEDAIHGAPDLVVEILSPGTAGRDLGPKRAAYERGGVTEYWIVDPEARTIEVLVLADGAYQRAGLYRSSDLPRSTVLADLTFEVAAVMV